MTIEQKLKALEDETKQRRLELMIKDVHQFDYYQLAFLNSQIENIMELQKQKQADLSQDQEKANQLKALETDAKQIQQTKERNKRPRLHIERMGEAIIRTKLK